MLVKNTTLIRHQTDTSLASVIGYAVFIQHVYCQSLPAAIAGGRVGQEPTPSSNLSSSTGVAPHGLGSSAVRAYPSFYMSPAPAVMPFSSFAARVVALALSRLCCARASPCAAAFSK